MDKIVKVLWVDSTSKRGWHSHKEADEFAGEMQDAITSVGFLLEDDGLNVTIYQSISKDQKNSLMKIPRAAVLSVREINAHTEMGEAGAAEPRVPRHTGH